MATAKTVSASLENYLEAIFHITEEKQAARAKDIAQRLKLKGSSVTGALHQLSERGLINYAPYDIITLTPNGKKIARDVVNRHATLREFFTKVLLLDDNTADDGACKLEHGISRKILDRLVKFMKFIELCPRIESHWPEAFKHYRATGNLPEICNHCVSVSPK
jgi:DtxR family Mn-dependent transcriptional regulator